MTTSAPTRRATRRLAPIPLQRQKRLTQPGMRTPLFRLPALTFFALLLWAGTATAQPTLTCDAPTHNFGTIQSTKQSLEHVFTLKNSGDTTLHISGIKTSCGCTTGEIGNKNLEPGGLTTIKASFNPSGRKGPQHKTITVQSDDPASPSYNMELTCDIKPGLDVEPPSLYFGAVHAPCTNQISTRIECTTNTTFRILGMDTGQLKRVSARLDTLETGRVYSITAQLILEGESTNGLIREHITLNTDMPGYETLTIPILVQITEEVRVRPSVIAVNQQSFLRDPLQVQLFLAADKARNWTITSVDAQGDMTVTTESMQPDRITIAIRGLNNPDSLPNKRIRLHVRAADGAERTVSVPFQYLSPKARNVP